MADRPARSFRARASKRLAAFCPLLTACCLFSGCNSGPQMQSDLYTRELRLQEDEIYRLEDCIEDYQAIIRGLRKENYDLQGQLGNAGGATPAADARGDREGDEASGERSLLDGSEWSPDRPEGPLAPEEEAPDIELPEIDGGAPSEAPAFDPAPEISDPADIPPEVELPVEPDADEGGSDAPFEIAPPPAAPLPTPEPQATPADAPIKEAPPFEPPPLSAKLANGPVTPAVSVGAPAPVDAVVETVRMSSVLGPREPTGEPTLIVRVAPLSAGGNTTLFQGEAALLLRDPTRGARDAELARWDYSPPEVTTSWQSASGETALAFALVLPEDVPVGVPLELWVRLKNDEGRKTLAKIPVTLGVPAELDPPGDALPIRQSKDSAAAAVNSDPPHKAAPNWSPRTDGTNSPRPGASTTWRRSRGGGQTNESEVRVAMHLAPAPLNSVEQDGWLKSGGD